VIVESMSKFFEKTIRLDPAIRTIVTWQTGTLTYEDAYKDFVRMLTAYGLTVAEERDGSVRVTLSSAAPSK